MLRLQHKEEVTSAVTGTSTSGEAQTQAPGWETTWPTVGGGGSRELQARGAYSGEAWASVQH